MHRLRNGLATLFNFSKWQCPIPLHLRRIPSCYVILRVPSKPLPKDFSENRRANPMWFELSSEDKKQIPPRLSAFASLFTLPKQAWQIAGSKADRDIVAAI